MSLTYIEIATHPDDLLVVCAEVESHPGKFATNFYRGEGHQYKPLLTSDSEEVFSNGRPAAILRIQVILYMASFTALYHGSAPNNSEQFIETVREAGYTEERLSNERATGFYNTLAEDGQIGLLSGMIDIKRVLNPAMIDEIMERLETEGSCDTSQKPLASFSESST